ENASAHVNSSLRDFANWLARSVVTVVALVVGVLVIGGAVNYLVVGRHRGDWSPDQVDGVGPRATPSTPPTPPGDEPR
ncbi:MAG TPA: hypothetical protein VGV64_03915, partial [Thermoplasmata archaeon]|nr:hypothetical protein [Thermoplasmata archaeon]